MESLGSQETLRDRGDRELPTHLRIEIPYLEVPIALDLAWPWFYEQSDDRRQFFFWISR
jgi:hypothetical protein